MTSILQPFSFYLKVDCGLTWVCNMVSACVIDCLDVICPSVFFFLLFPFFFFELLLVFFCKKFFLGDLSNQLFSLLPNHGFTFIVGHCWARAF